MVTSTENNKSNSGKAKLWSGALLGPEPHRMTFSLDKPWVIAVTGPRGAGKSLLLCQLGCKALAAGIPVWSNMKISFTLEDHDHKVRHLESEPLDLETLYRLGEDVSGGIIIMDELLYYADSRQSGRVGNRILYYALRQSRKRQLSFFWSSFSMGQVDLRLRAETDLEFRCSDASKTPWGLRETQLVPGEMVFVDVLDLSGALTGRPLFGKKFYTYADIMQFRLYGKPFWNCYNTAEIVDHMEASRPIDLELTPRRLGDKSFQHMAERGLVAQTAQRFIDRGELVIPALTFWDTAGVSSEQRKQLGKYRNELGIRMFRSSKGGGAYFLDLSDFTGVPDDGEDEDDENVDFAGFIKSMRSST